MKRPEEIADEFQKAWNSHEMAALASLFCEDATFVNRFGHYVRGVQEIVSLHAPIHETIYSDSTMENEVISTIALGDDAAVANRARHQVPFRRCARISWAYESAVVAAVST